MNLKNNSFNFSNYSVKLAEALDDGCQKAVSLIAEAKTSHTSLQLIVETRFYRGLRKTRAAVTRLQAGGV
jgi:hypothetical protein